MPSRHRASRRSYAARSGAVNALSSPLHFGRYLGCTRVPWRGESCRLSDIITNFGPRLNLAARFAFHDDRTLLVSGPACHTSASVDRSPPPGSCPCMHISPTVQELTVWYLTRRLKTQCFLLNRKRSNDPFLLHGRDWKESINASSEYREMEF